MSVFFSWFMGNELKRGTHITKNHFAVHAICLSSAPTHSPGTKKKRNSFFKYTCHIFYNDGLLVTYILDKIHRTAGIGNQTPSSVIQVMNISVSKCTSLMKSAKLPYFSFWKTILGISFWQSPTKVFFTDGGRAGQQWTVKYRMSSTGWDQ